MGTTLVLSTRVSREIYENFIKTIGPNTCASGALRDLVMDHIARKETRGGGAGQKLISEREQLTEGAIEKGPGSPRIYVNKASQVEEETPSKPTSLQALKLGSDKALIERTSPCPFHALEGDQVLCKKDETKKDVIYRITQQICDWCWNFNPKCPGRTMSRGIDAQE